MNDHIPDATKMISDTPRTDKVLYSVDVCDGEEVVNIAFARQLERELNVANLQMELLTKSNFQLREGRLELKQRIKRLEDSIEKLKDAGDLVFIWLLYNRSHLGGLDVDSALREWKQSKKEAKP